MKQKQVENMAADQSEAMKRLRRLPEVIPTLSEMRAAFHGKGLSGTISERQIEKLIAEVRREKQLRGGER